MELKQLEYLIAVAESGSMYLAAERLHVSRQNISRVLKQLEEELETPIFLKTNQGTKLSLEGEKIYWRALQIMKEVALLKEEQRSAYPNPDSLQGKITIYYSNTLSSFVENYMFPFQEQHSSIIFSTTESTTNEILFKLSLEETPPVAIIQLSMDKLLREKKTLEKKYNCYLHSTEALKVLVHKDNPIAKQSTISLKRLKSLTFAVKTPSSEHIPEFIQTVLDLGIQLNLKYYSNSETSILKYLKQNQACSLTTNFNEIPNLSSNLSSIRIKEGIYVALCILIPKEKTPCMQTFADHILANMPSYTTKLF